MVLDYWQCSIIGYIYYLIYGYMYLLHVSYREQFLKETKEFSQSFDLKGSGKYYREQQMKKKVTLLQAETLMLETGWSFSGIICMKLTL